MFNPFTPKKYLWRFGYNFVFFHSMFFWRIYIHAFEATKIPLETGEVCLSNQKNHQFVIFMDLGERS